MTYVQTYRGSQEEPAEYTIGTIAECAECGSERDADDDVDDFDDVDDTILCVGCQTGCGICGNEVRDKLHFFADVSFIDGEWIHDYCALFGLQD